MIKPFENLIRHSSGVRPVTPSAQANIWYTYDVAGNIVHVKDTYVFHGQLTNSLTGQVFKDHRAGQENVDFRDLTYTLTGSTFHLINPGEGTVFHDAGKIVINIVTGQVLWQSGKFEMRSSGLDVCGWVGDGVIIAWQPLN